MFEKVQNSLDLLDQDLLVHELKEILKFKNQKKIDELTLLFDKNLDDYQRVRESYLLLNSMIEIGELEWSYFYLKKRIDKLPYIGKVETDFFLAVTNLIGKRKEFLNFFYKVIEELITNKNYGLFHKVYEAYRKKVSNNDAIYIIELLVAVEEKDVESISRIYEAVRTKILQEKFSIKTLQQMYLLLEQFGEDDVRVYQYKIFFKCILNVYKVDICSAIQLIDFVFLSQDIIDLLIVHEICPSHSASEMLELYLKDKVTITDRDNYQLLKNFKFFLSSKKKIAIRRQDPDHEKVILSDNTNYENIKLGEQIKFIIPAKYKLKTDEKNLLNHNFQNNSEEMVTSMIASEYYTVALMLLENLENKTSNYYYLKAVILYYMNKYSEAIDLINVTIDEKLKLADEVYGFELLKAKAFYALGDYERALKSYEKAKTLEPGLINKVDYK